MCRHRSSSWRPSPPYRAESTPGRPPSASTSIPESSASANVRVASATARAFRSALSSYDASPSAGSVSDGKSDRSWTWYGMPARSARSSRPLARLAVARTSARSENEDLLATRPEGATLESDEPSDAGGRKRQHLVQALLGKRGLLRGALDLDERARARHHDVHVHLGRRVLPIVEVEERLPAHDPHADGGDTITEQWSSRHVRLRQRSERIGNGDEGARDGGGSRAAVGLDDIAIHPDRALAELRHLDNRAQRASHQTLDLLRSPTRPGALARRPRVRRARQHTVLGRHPALALALQERRDPVLHGGRADDFGVAELDQHGALGMAEIVSRDRNGSELIRLSAVTTRHRLRSAGVIGPDGQGARRAHALVVTPLVFGESVVDGAGEGLTVLRRVELPLFLHIRQEPDLDENRRHGRSPEHVESRLLDAARNEAERAGHGIENCLRHETRLLLKLGLRQVPQDALQHLALLTIARVFVLHCSVLDGRDVARLAVRCLRREEIDLHTFRNGLRVGIGVDGHEQVRALL